MAEKLSPALRAVSDAVLAVASQRSVEEVLQRLVDCARELVGARYAALGVPDGDGGFGQFLVSGMSDELIASMGALPRTHGLLAVMLETPESYRTTDIRDHPRFNGWWPDEHPDMRSFLGVPIVASEGVIGAFYLTEKDGPAEFGEDDQELIELLAAHAAIAITNARLYEASRELSIVSERNRLALELHDTVSQRLFSLVLTAEAAGLLVDRDPRAASASIDKVKDLGRQALEELRSLIFELRPPDLEKDGLSATLRKHVDVLRPLQETEIALEVDGAAIAPDPRRDQEILRIAQEALHNALRHSRANRVVRSAQSVEQERRSAWRRLLAEAIRVLLVDDHAVVREGLRAFLELQHGIDVVGEASDGREAISEAERLRPHVILMDLVMPELDGLGAMQELRQRVPEARVIVLTSFIDDERLLPAVRAGAAGYLLKNVAPQELARAVRAAHAGEAHIDPAVAARLVDAISERGARDSGLELLTRREREVLELIGRGLSNKRIALELGVAEKTVKTHVGHVLRKLDVTDRTQAALFAVRAGLAGRRS